MTYGRSWELNCADVLVNGWMMGSAEDPVNT